jgi:protein phosphatase
MTLQQLTDLDAAVEQLVDLAIRSGGPDNITCVLADVIDADAGQEPSEQIIIVGALATDDPEGSEPTRSDNPAARAHLLAQTAQSAQIAQIANDDPDGSEPDPPSPTAAAEVEDADDADGVGRRRWPVVTCVLMLLVGVVGAAGYYGWRLTQNQYYVGTADGRVVVFRGLSQAIAGVSLSTVVQRTNIPLSALPSSEVGYIKSTIGPESNLKQAQRIISQFRHDYRCAVAAADITKWVANRPKPAQSTHKPGAGTHSKSKPTRRPTRPTAQPATHKNTAHKGTTAASHRGAKPAGKHTTAPHRPAKQVKYPPEPVMPPYCPAYQGAAG